MGLGRLAIRLVEALADARHPTGIDRYPASPRGFAVVILDPAEEGYEGAGDVAGYHTDPATIGRIAVGCLYMRTKREVCGRYNMMS